MIKFAQYLKDNTGFSFAMALFGIGAIAVYAMCLLIAGINWVLDFPVRWDAVGRGGVLTAIVVSFLMSLSWLNYKWSKK